MSLWDCCLDCVVKFTFRGEFEDGCVADGYGAVLVSVAQWQAYIALNSRLLGAPVQAQDDSWVIGHPHSPQEGLGMKCEGPILMKTC